MKWFLVIFDWNFRVFYLRGKPEWTTAATFPLHDEVVFFFWGSSCLRRLSVCAHVRDADEGGRRSCSCFCFFCISLLCRENTCVDAIRTAEDGKAKSSSWTQILCILLQTHFCSRWMSSERETVLLLCCSKKGEEEAGHGEMSGFRNSCGIWCKGAKTHLKPTPQPR